MKLIFRPDQKKKNLVLFVQDGKPFHVSLALLALVGFSGFLASLLLIGDRPENVFSFFIFVVLLYCIDLRKSYISA